MKHATSSARFGRCPFHLQVTSFIAACCNLLYVLSFYRSCCGRGFRSVGVIVLQQWRRQVHTGRGANIWGPVDGGTEGPERAEGVGPGEGRHSPSQYGGLCLCPQKILR